MVVSPWLDTASAAISPGLIGTCRSACRTVLAQACQYTSGFNCARSGAGTSSWYSSRSMPMQLPSGAKMPAFTEVVPASMPSRYGMSHQVVLGCNPVGRLEVLDDFLQRVEQAVRFRRLDNVASKDDASCPGFHRRGGKLQRVALPRQLFGAQCEHRHR